MAKKSVSFGENATGAAEKKKAKKKVNTQNLSDTKGG
jgi:hypothetical protein